MSKESVFHHFVPRSILRNFENEDGKIFVFDKKNSNSFASNINDAGAENNFNTSSIDGVKNNFEHIFQENDGKVAVLIRRLKELENDFNLSEEETYQLAKITLIQSFRTKLPRTDSIGVAKDLAKKLGLLLRDMEEIEKNELPASMTEEGSKSITPSLLNKINELLPYYLERSVVVFRANEQNPLWCSDNPVIIQNQDPQKGRALLNEGTHIYFPISKTLLVAFYCKETSYKIKIAYEICVKENREMPINLKDLYNGIVNKKILKLDESEIYFYNFNQIINSSRFIYSSENEFLIAKDILSTNPQFREISRTSRML